MVLSPIYMVQNKMIRHEFLILALQEVDTRNSYGLPHAEGSQVVVGPSMAM